LPPAVASSDLSANHGTVTHNHNTKVLIAWSTSLLFLISPVIDCLW
jgi:hypothetical protein